MKSPEYKMFEMYVKRYNVAEIRKDTANDGYTWCTQRTCLECDFLTECKELDDARMIVLTEEEIKIAQKEYPEYFI